jgi:hypothetical protein
MFITSTNSLFVKFQKQIVRLAKNFKGVIDLLTMEVITWDSEDLGRTFTRYTT